MKEEDKDEQVYYPLIEFRRYGSTGSHSPKPHSPQENHQVADLANKRAKKVNVPPAFLSDKERRWNKRKANGQFVVNTKKEKPHDTDCICKKCVKEK